MMYGGFLVGFLVVVAAERAYERRFFHRAVRGERKMEWSYRALHSLMITIWIVTAVEYFSMKRPICWWATGVGLALFVIALVVRLTAIRELGRFWSLYLEIRPEHELITTGIYRYLRHPAYLAIMLEVIAVPLVGNAYYTLILSIGVYIPILLIRWHGEEREMVVRFGERYTQYCREVPAFLPSLRPGTRR